jgi:hypothetical protein
MTMTAGSGSSPCLQPLVVFGNHRRFGATTFQQGQQGRHRRAAAGELGQPFQENPPLQRLVGVLVVEIDDVLAHATLPYDAVDRIAPPRKQDITSQGFRHGLERQEAG